MLGVNEALPSDTLVTIGGGNGNTSRLDINQKTQTLGGLTTAGSNTRQVVNVNSTSAPGGSPGTVILDIADGDSHVFGSSFGVNAVQEKGNLNLIKKGLGSQALYAVFIAGDVTVEGGLLTLGDNSGNVFFNDATVHGGELLIDEDTTANDFVVNSGGILTLNRAITGNSYTVNTGGLLNFGTGGNSGFLDGANLDITNDGTVKWNRNDGATYTGVMSGGGGLQVDGGGSLTLTGTNTFTGPVEVLNGKLFVGNSTALPDLSKVTVNAGEIFTIPFDGSNYNSSDAATVSSTVNFVDPSAYLELDISTGSITLADDLAAGNHGMQVLGGNSDVLTLTAAQTYLGGTRIYQGQLRLGASDLLPASSVLDIGGAGTAEFDMNGFNQTVGGLPNTAGSTRKIDNRSTNPSILTIHVADGNSFIYTANIFETGGSTISLVKTGLGEQGFEKTGLTSYTGSATANAGILRFRYPGAIDPTTQAITANADGTFAVDVGGASEWLQADVDSLIANATFNVNSYLGLRTDGAPFDYTSNLSGVIGIHKLGDDALTLSGVNTHTGRTLISAGRLRIDAEDDLGANPAALVADQLQLNGGDLRIINDLTIDDANRGITAGPNGGSLDANGFTMTLDSPISGSGNLLFSGSDITAPGNLHVVNGVNTMTGETRIFSAQLQVSSATNLPLTSNLAFSGNAIVLLAGNLDGTTSDFERPLGTAGGEVSWPNGGGFGAVGADRSIDIGGSGAQLTWGDPDFLAGTAFAYLCGGNAATHKATLLNDIGLPDPELAGLNYSFRVIDGPATIEGELAGIISGNGGLLIRENGALIFSGDNTYLGETQLQNTSTLYINGDQSAATGTVTVGPAATLGGTGIIGGAVYVNGTLASGSSVGSLEMLDGLDFNDNSQFDVEIDSSVPSSDQIVVSGYDVTIGTGVSLNVTDIAGSPATLSPGTKLTLIDYNGFSIIGTFDGLNNGDQIVVGPNTFEIQYEDTGATALTLTAVASNTYAAWASGYSLAGGFGDDDDLDGVTNGFEWYFHNSNPTIPEGLGAAISEVTQTGAGSFTFTHLRPVDRTGTHETYEWSADLSTWTGDGGTEGGITVTVTPGSTVPDADPDYETVTVTVTASPTTAARIFARLELSNP